MSDKVRLAIRGFKNGILQFAELVESNGEDLDVLAEKHARSLMDAPHMIEIEFLDEPDTNARFFRFGTDPRGMVAPVAICVREEVEEEPRAFPPLAPGHPAIWEECALCPETFKAGDVTMLVPNTRTRLYRMWIGKEDYGTAAERQARMWLQYHQEHYPNEPARIEREPDEMKLTFEASLVHQSCYKRAISLMRLRNATDTSRLS